MREKLLILLPIGAAMGLFSVVVPFSDIFSGKSEYIEDIIYWRGILISIILFCIGSAAVLQSYQKAIVISICCGAISLLSTSTLNLINNDFIETENYFLYTIYFSGASLMIVILIKNFGVFFISTYKILIKKIRLCWNKQFRGL